jgi:dTDP-L-rhamnose 4-epimerase
MARALHAAAGVATPAPEVVGGYRLGDVRHVFADLTRARRVLGFQATEDFDAGMAALAAELS